jgi:ProQ/FINO family
MGPHPKRKIITLRTKLPIAPAWKPVIGSETVASVASVVGASQPRLAGPAASTGLPSLTLTARRRKRDSALTWLASTYPAVFGADVKPLVIGAGRLIWPRAKAEGVGRSALNDALQRRTTAPAYLDALSADGALRFGLDGLAIEPVSPEHRECAIAMKAGLALKWHGRNTPKSA